ncbi:hypothetical protein [Carboxylicivirga sp. RSCT41]|uniref:hypothetical protein n=1 Tax=Carboxylicivirga agarovorans TaxID=3417570 RepID=UPI003D33EBAB
MKTGIYIMTFLLAFVQFVDGQTLTVPENHVIIDSVYGDLNKDGINELVVAYNTKPEIDFESVPRVLIIYQRDKDHWKEWKRSDEALYGSRDGGMMGDPYGEMEIKNGVLLISQNGGSSWKWGFTDKYRFQNGEFYLIGYTSLSGKPCENWKSVDFNLSTGKMIVKVEYEQCDTDGQEVSKSENETLTKSGIKITLQKRQECEIEIVTPKYGHVIYIATGKG